MERKADCEVWTDIMNCWNRKTLDLIYALLYKHSVMIWDAMSSAGVGTFCFLKTNVTAPVYQDILEHFMPPSADQLFKDADFTFQQTTYYEHNLHES